MNTQSELYAAAYAAGTDAQRRCYDRWVKWNGERVTLETWNGELYQRGADDILRPVVGPRDWDGEVTQPLTAAWPGEGK
jgi:hypothetical protein